MPDRRCPGCGLLLRELLGSRRAGCDQCYRIFSRELEPLRPNARDGAESGDAARWRRWRALAATLAEAVLTEDFERAARLKQAMAKLRSAPPR